MRKILYSPGYGAGFVSWSHGSSKQKKFMLEYKPFVEFLEGGGKFTEILVKCEPEEYDASSGLLPKELIVQFKADWDKAFPEKAGDYPYLGESCSFGFIK